MAAVYELRHARRPKTDPQVVLAVSESAFADILAASARLTGLDFAWIDEVLDPLFELIPGGPTESLTEAICTRIEGEDERKGE